jgi:Flp pilus assembly protein TadG
MKKTWSEAGASLVELALVVGILGPPLLLGTLEISVFLYSSIELTDATHAAAAYAAQYYIQDSGASLPTQAEVSAAAANDAPELVGMLKSGTSFTATMATGCGTGTATTGNTVPTCTSGTLPYVQVTGTVTVVPIAHYLSFASLTMTSTAQVDLVN